MHCGQGYEACVYSLMQLSLSNLFLNRNCLFSLTINAIQTWEILYKLQNPAYGCNSTFCTCELLKEKSRIRETLNLSTCAESSTDTEIIFTALFYNALNCTLLHSLLHCTELQYNALFCTALHCTALHCTAPSISVSPSLSTFYINVFLLSIQKFCVVFLFPSVVIIISPL